MATNAFRHTSSFVAITAALVCAACTAREEASDTPPPGPNVVTVRASDFSYTMPNEIPAGMTTFELVNDGPNLHHMLIARIDSGKTVDEARDALTKGGPPPAWIVPVGGPNAPDPGAQSNATLDLPAGDYIVVCMVDIPGGVPHMMKGMYSPLKVVPSTATTVAAAAPEADITIGLQDYTFTVSKPLTAGAHTIAVTNSPGQPHEVELIRLLPGKTMADVGKDVGMLMAGKPLTGPFSAQALGGISPLMAGNTQYFSVDLTPGNYALVCFLADAKDGKPHMEHGMVKEFTVE